MLGPDVIVTKLTGFLDGQFEDALGLWSERNFTEGQRLGEAGERALDLGLDRLQTEPEALQHGRGDTFAVPDETQKHVLGADEIVPEPTRFFPGQDDDPPRPLGEPFKHWCPPPLFQSVRCRFRFGRRLVNPKSRSV